MNKMKGMLNEMSSNRHQEQSERIKNNKETIKTNNTQHVSYCQSSIRIYDELLCKYIIIDEINRNML